MYARAEPRHALPPDRACRPNLRGAPASCLVGWGLLVHTHRHTRHSPRAARAAPARGGVAPHTRRDTRYTISMLPRAHRPHAGAATLPTVHPTSSVCLTPYSVCLYLLGVKSPRDRGIILLEALHAPPTQSFATPTQLFNSSSSKAAEAFDASRIHLYNCFQSHHEWREAGHCASARRFASASTSIILYSKLIAISGKSPSP